MAKSFTLIELIVVIAIIAILAAIIAPNAFRAIDKSKVARMVIDLKAIKSACQGYYTDIGQWPAVGQIKSNHPLLADSGARGWDGPYLEKPARAPSWIGYISPGCSPPGYYFLASYDCWCCPVAYGYFDLDKNPATGSPPPYEMVTALSACIYGIPALVRKGLNMALDGDASDDDQSGNLKVRQGGVGSSTGGCPDFIFYYIGSF